MLTEQLKELKTQNFREKAAEQRDKIHKLKETDELIEEATKAVEEVAKAAPVAEQEFKVDPAKRPESSHSKTKAKKAAKPAWATTEKQAEEVKEAEIDELLEFAYELDYEKYMEDFEVRQALALIKERVSKIKEEPDWKEKMADEWNQANKAANKDSDTKSHNSYSKSPAPHVFVIQFRLCCHRCFSEELHEENGRSEESRG